MSSTLHNNWAAAVLCCLARTVGAHVVVLRLLRVAAAAIGSRGAWTVGAHVVVLGFLRVAAASVLS